MNFRALKPLRVLALFLCLAALASGCAGKSGKNVLFQAATIDSLSAGGLDGGVSIGELSRRGDTGLGTVDGLDGEMVVARGVFYRVAHDGAVNVIDKGVRSPFAMVVFFSADRTVAIPGGASLADATDALEAALPTKNLYYAVRLTGTFSQLKVRSVPGQSRPYPPLAKALAEQSVFELENVAGTMVGFRCPKNVGGLNVPGWHLHFISDPDAAGKRVGGHVLAGRVGAVTAEVADLRQVEMVFPKLGDFDATPPAGEAQPIKGEAVGHD
ncbi:acetolactate decarboxylase [Desulfovibrio sulfodismutans]|uniref:Alpha-acetolactate decarboxylase n=1 Tax=Desulfolutivibrio sulfodismutans TaxID=63561 RepID=A0A7K3NRR5_9BACT|nr:acetolactate decarboxylase [Desulfolutivibrio sulfodismutans]NDY58894.1 acetolactate decarboxylase [Desulfolutivibrio sulfodismutans]QLA14021.1 acetolactate decarboxylase [Desulfolutivibrio sulfodismutans DSM 3696]